MTDKNVVDEEWKNTKTQRAALENKYGRRCAYCGNTLNKMQADHLEPVIRLTVDAGGRPLPSSERKMLMPHRNKVSNMMPACAPCNNSKGGHSLECWRDLIYRSGEIVAKQKPIFRAGVRMGVITVSREPVVFYFEKGQANDR